LQIAARPGAQPGLRIRTPALTGAKGLIMNFSLKLTPRVEHVMWGAVGGAAAMAFVGFYFAGWVTGGAAATMAQQKADKAVVAALAPICVDKFRHAQNADDNLGKLKAVSSSWDKGTYVSTGGWATMPGSVEPNTAVAQACAEMLSTAAK
jgi:hypothetical protein